MWALSLEHRIVALTGSLALHAVPALRSTFVALASEYQLLVPCTIQESDKGAVSQGPIERKWTRGNVLPCPEEGIEVKQ